LSIAVLIVARVGTGYIFGVAGTFFFAGAGQFLAAIDVLLVFILLGHWLEMRARSGASSAIKELMNLTPATAKVIRDGAEVYQAELFKEIRPVHVGQQPHRRDDVAHRDVRSGKPLLCVGNNSVDRHALPAQSILEPREKRRLRRVEPTQTLGGLGRENFGQGVGLIGADGALHRQMLRLAGRLLGGQNRVHDCIGLLAKCVSLDDPRRKTPHVFDQHNAQRDRDSPQLADHQRLRVLIH
jgi:hypothetical protein